MRIFYFFIFLFFTNSYFFAQKDSLQLGDKYSEDQLYLSLSYAQLNNQPSSVSRSSFSYAFSLGFFKDIPLTQKGNFSIAAGIGYGYYSFNHDLKVEESNNVTLFSSALNIDSNQFRAHNLEFPIEIRWRTSTAKKYSFWRIYTGIKFLYNFSNSFSFIENNSNFEYFNVSAYNRLQYGLTFSAGYDAFNFNIFYGLTPIFKEGATINSESINTSILKFGFIFYIL